MVKKKKKTSGKDYDIYFKERESLVKLAAEQSASYDKYLLSISAGTFGLSVTFLKDILSSIQRDTVCLVIIAWSFIAFTILLTLSSFIFGKLSFYKQIELLEALYFRGEKINNIFTIITSILNIISGLSFVTGITFLFIFVASNLTK
jgi:hypothetical protein